MAEYEVEPMLW